MRTEVFCVLAGVFAAGLPAQVGKPMPSLEINKLYNLDAKPKNITDLRGSAVFIEYWQTW
ncbi:MAG TPA: hypothetical protein VK348_03190 [Planctomycetota bacterium]|nr:hypothetical protein [Planctomycetota bacterium]